MINDYFVTVCTQKSRLVSRHGRRFRLNFIYISKTVYCMTDGKLSGQRHDFLGWGRSNHGFI